MLVDPYNRGDKCNYRDCRRDKIHVYVCTDYKTYMYMYEGRLTNLVCPHAFECVLIWCGAGDTQQHSLDDSSKVPQVEQVVGLGWCG